MGNEVAIRGRPVLDWFLALPDGALPAHYPPLDDEWHQAAEPRSTALPEVAFGQAPAPRINPTKRELRFVVPLADGQSYLGDIELAVSPQDALSVEAPRLLTLLEPIVKREVHDRLAAAVGPSGMLDQAALDKEGIALAYDAQTLALGVVVPLDKRETRALSLRGGRGRAQPTLQPAGFSGHLNVHAAMDFTQAGPSSRVVPPTAALDGALRVHGVVLEGEGYLSGRREDPVFRRTGTRLVYEDLAHEMRWTAGDAQIYPRQFQATPSVLGLGVSRLYSQLDPQREIRASGMQSFSVLGASTIETFVNGRSVERRTFQPGNYTLRDFPLAEGANTVQLRVEDASGKVRLIDFSVYANQQLTAKGVTEFALFGGVSSTPSIRGFAYSHDWIATGFVRTGLTEQVTAGANFQANGRVAQAGIEVVWGSPLGLVGFNLAGSRSTVSGTGFAAAMTYERVLGSPSGLRNTAIRAAAEWRSRDFDTPNQVYGPEATELRASAGAVFTLGANTYVAADGQYQRDRLSGEESWGARLSGGINLGWRLSATGEFGINRGGSRDETYVRLGLRLRVGERGTLQADADSKGRARTSFSTSGGSGNGAWQTWAELSHDEQAVAFNGSAGLQTNRLELGLQQTANWDKAGGRIAESRTTVRAAFALAFADGAVALGRPVSEAFLIARPHRTLRGKPVYVEPSEGSEIARSGGLGAALHGQLSAHNPRTVIYQVPDAPAGYDLGAGNVSIDPPYRAGYRLVVGSDYNLMVVGRLVGRDGQPVRLLAGKAVDLGNAKHLALTIFTSRDGRFGAQGLRPGRWRIDMPTEPPTSFEFAAGEGTDGIARVGDLTPVQPERDRR